MNSKILQCPECSSSFRIKPEAIGDTGRMVRCAQCKHEWLANRLDLRDDPSTKDAAAVTDAPKDTVAVKAEAEESNDAFSALMNDTPIDTLQPESDAAAEKKMANDATIFHFDKPVEDTKPETEEPKPEPEAVEDVTTPESPVIPDVEDSIEDAEDSDDMPDIATLFPELPANTNDADTEKMQRKFRNNRRLLYVANAACLLMVMAISLITFREQVLRTFPAVKPLYAAFGYHPTDDLKLGDIIFSKNDIRGEVQYSVKGNILNGTDASSPTPAIRARLLDNRGDVLNEWNLSKDDTLKPNERKAFSAKKLRSDAEGAHILSLEIGSSIELSLRK